MTYSKTAEDLEIETLVLQLAERLCGAREGSAAHKMILRQLDGIRRSELGGLIMEEYDAGSTGNWG